MIEIPPKSYRQFETFFSENTVISKIISSGWGGGGGVQLFQGGSKC